jgi:hypothetical protein
MPFIEPARLVDVLIDQLEYLVSHASRGCPPGCPDCFRLQQVKKLLLIPFDSPNMPKAPEPLLRESVAPPSHARLSVAREFLKHTEAKNRPFRGVVENMEPNQPRIEITVGILSPRGH